MAFIQIGETALRSPHGEPLPSVPLYIKACDELRLGLVDDFKKDICGFFYEHYKKEPIAIKNSADTLPTTPTEFTAKHGTISITQNDAE